LDTYNRIVAALINHGGQFPLALAMSSILSTTPTHTTTSQLPLATAISTATQSDDTLLDQFMEELLVADLSLIQCVFDIPCQKRWWREQLAWWTETLAAWYSGSDSSILMEDDDDEKLREIPQFVLDYAPYCWLYSAEDYWPSRMEEHIEHTTPFQDYDPLDDQVDINNLEVLNKYGYKRVFLTSDDDPESYPEWMGSRANIPDNSGYTPAPAILIVVDKGAYVDAFWFFWYSFNLGNQVLGIRFGNHIGDWEHTMIRFHKRTEKPIQVFFSEHEWGAGYPWQDCELEGDRVSHDTLSSNLLLISTSFTHILPMVHMRCIELRAHILMELPEIY
jgi:hypothetical protein